MTNFQTHKSRKKRTAPRGSTDETHMWPGALQVLLTCLAPAQSRPPSRPAGSHMRFNQPRTNITWGEWTVPALSTRRLSSGPLSLTTQYNYHWHSIYTAPCAVRRPDTTEHWQEVVCRLHTGTVPLRSQVGLEANTLNAVGQMYFAAKLQTLFPLQRTFWKKPWWPLRRKLLLIFKLVIKCAIVI